MLLLRLAARLLFVLNVQICLYQCRAPWFLPALARPMRQARYNTATLGSVQQFSLYFILKNLLRCHES